jgi:adenylate cyclase
MLKRVSAFVFGEQTPSHLPQRMRIAIIAHQIQSEVLIGWVQLFLVVFFAALYTIAPKTSEGTDFMPVPWGLAIYFVFTVTRLFLSYRGTLPSWFLVISVILDVGLLMALIWSFHLQYEQPASFYLKAPTLLYVFILIALRTLRFEPRYVLVAGMAAACGWLFMLWYALLGENTLVDPMTRDYVLYMTSNRVLVGAEIDKILSILLVTLVLVVALVRARRLLVRSLVDGAAARDLSRFVSPEIAGRITMADKAIEPGDGEVKVATVMFTDIEGFSSIAERLEPGEMMKTLNEYLAVVSEVIERHGGVVTQFDGDGMLITFNTTKPDPDHAANAVRAAMGIQEVLNAREFGPGILLKTRCGVNTGRLVAGAVGTKDRLLFTVHGDEVNIAARLEPLNKEYGTYILITEQTVRESGGDFPFERIGDVTVRGRATPTTVYAIRT